MEISVSSLLQSPHDVTRHPFEEWVELGEQEKLLSPLAGELVVTRVSDQLLKAEGDFHARLQLPCDRCGNPFETETRFHLDEMLEVSSTPPTANEVEEMVYVQGTLDATDLIRQGLLLSLPPRSLCGCEPLSGPGAEQKTDARWEALQSFAPKQTGPKT